MVTGWRVGYGRSGRGISRGTRGFFTALVGMVSIVVCTCVSVKAFATGKDIYVRSAMGALFKLHNPSAEVRGYTCTGCGDTTWLDFPKDSEHIAVGMRRFPCTRCKIQLCPECDWATDVCPGKDCTQLRQGETGSSHSMDVDGTIQGRIKESEVTCTTPNCINSTLPIKLRDINSHTSHQLKIPQPKDGADNTVGAAEEMMEVAIAANPANANIGKTSFPFAGTKNCPTCEKFRIANEYNGDRVSNEYRTHRKDECTINRRLCATCHRLIPETEAKSHRDKCLAMVLEKYSSSTPLPSDVLDKAVRQMVPWLSEQKLALAGEVEKNRDLATIVQQQAQSLSQLQQLYSQLCGEHKALNSRCEQLEGLLRQQLPYQGFGALPIEPVDQDRAAANSVASQSESFITPALVDEALSSGRGSQASLSERFSQISPHYDAHAEQTLMVETSQQMPAYLSPNNQCSIAFGNQDLVRLLGDTPVVGSNHHISDFIYTREIRGQERSSELAFIVPLPTDVTNLDSTIHLPEFEVLEAVEGYTEMFTRHLRLVIRAEGDSLIASLRYLEGEKPVLAAPDMFEWIGFIRRDNHIISAFDFLPASDVVAADTSELDSLGFSKAVHARAAWSLADFEESVQPIRVNNEFNESFVFLVLGVKPDRMVIRQGREQANSGCLVDNMSCSATNEGSPRSPKRRKLNLDAPLLSE